MLFKLKNKYFLLFLLFNLFAIKSHAQIIPGTIPEINYSNLSSCSLGLVRDVYVRDSTSPNSCGPGGGTYTVRCSCSYDYSDLTYKWRATKTVIGAASEGGSNVASDVTIVDAGSYFTGINVESAMQEIGLTLNSIEPPIDNFVSLSDVGSLSADSVIMWDGSYAESYTGFNANTNDFTISPTISGNDICLENGDNCPSFVADDLTNNNLNDLSDVEATSTDNYVLIYDGAADNRWESRILTASDIPVLPLTKLQSVSNSQFSYFNISGVLSSISCADNEVLVSNGTGVNPECVSIGNQTTIDIDGDSEAIGPLNSIYIVNHSIGDSVFIYDGSTDTLQIDYAEFPAPDSEPGYKVQNLNEPPDDVNTHVYYDIDMQDMCIETGSGWISLIGNIACELIQYTLDITLAGSGTGTITSTPSGINCGITCSADYDEDEVVTLNNIPDSGMQFDGYSGNADCSDGSVTMSSNKSCTATFSVIPSGGNATNWTSSLQSVWTLDEGSGTRVSGGSCGTTCNVTEFPGGTTIVNSTTEKVYGTAAAFIDSSGSNNVRFGCTNTSCTNLRGFNSGSTMGDFSVGLWIRPNTSARSQNRFMENFDGSTTGGGFRLYVTNDGTVNAGLYTAPATSINLMANAACPANQWCHIALTFEEDTDDVTGGNQPLATLYVNGTSRATNTSLTGAVVDPDSGKLFRLCGTSDNATKFDGYCDSAWTSLSALTSAQICRICRSGVSGEGGVCNGSDNTLYISQSQTCGSCTPSACNATLP